MASREKKPPLSEIDLALAATAPVHRKKAIIKAATGEGGYDYYHGVRSNYAAILRVAINPFLTAPTVSAQQAKSAIEHACYDSNGELSHNIGMGAGLLAYRDAHNVTGGHFDFEPVSLGRAGRRHFWSPMILEVDGKRCIPFFDPRLDGLDSSAMRFIFSINHTHIRLQDALQYGTHRLVIFKFGPLANGVRPVTAHFDEGERFWTAKEIGEMIDETYRVLDEIRRAA
jgi:hypothetical protein